jgi:hypothetical protein
LPLTPRLLERQSSRRLQQEEEGRKKKLKDTPTATPVPSLRLSPLDISSRRGPKQKPLHTSANIMPTFPNIINVMGFTAIDPILEAALPIPAASAVKAVLTSSSGTAAAEEKNKKQKGGKKKTFIILKRLGLSSLLQEVKIPR